MYVYANNINVSSSIYIYIYIYKYPYYNTTAPPRACPCVAQYAIIL